MYGDNEYLSLEFFVTEPIETLYKKRTHFLTTTDQWKDPSRWDMKNQVLRSPDDRDGCSLNPYMVACDDTELGKPAYIAGKNVGPCPHRLQTTNALARPKLVPF